MKQLSKKMIVSLLSGSLLIGAAPLMAAEDISSGDNTDQNSNSGAGGYLKLGFGYQSLTGPYSKQTKGFSLFFNGRYQWQNGLFIELPGDSSKLEPGIAVGYNFYNTEHWDFDLITNQTHGNIVYNVVQENQQSIAIHRDSTTMLGIRGNGYYGDNTVRMTIMPYSFNHDYDTGVYASLWLARNWQLKNWNIHSSIGFQYRSEEIMDYYYGISQQIAIDSTPAYHAGSGINITGQIGASYPLSESWVFESYLRYTEFSDSINDSPIVKNAISWDPTRSNNEYEFSVMMNYVF
ncbi:MAG: MipA/OmpV family protein [Psychrosphaera sp.]|nr:MipA/OmpV family protein [Psychrosphaera sp.]